MEAKEAKREERKTLTGPLVDELDPLAEEEDVDALGDGLVDEEASEDEDDRPDLMLRESARIVADMVRLGADTQLLATQFSLVQRENRETMN